MTITAVATPADHTKLGQIGRSANDVTQIEPTGTSPASLSVGEEGDVDKDSPDDDDDDDDSAGADDDGGIPDEMDDGLPDEGFNDGLDEDDDVDEFDDIDEDDFDDDFDDDFEEELDDDYEIEIDDEISAEFGLNTAGSNEPAEDDVELGDFDDFENLHLD